MITVPLKANTDSKKMEYGLRAAEKLRLYHNVEGAKVDVKDPVALKAWHKWQSDVFEPLQREALHIANLAKQAMYKSETWDSEIDVEAWIVAKEVEVRK